MRAPLAVGRASFGGSMRILLLGAGGLLFGLIEQAVAQVIAPAQFEVAVQEPVQPSGPCPPFYLPADSPPVAAGPTLLKAVES